MLTRRGFLRLTAAAGVGGLLPWRIGIERAAMASPLQVPLDPSSIPQFVDPLPSLDVLTAGTERISLHMREFLAPVMSSSFVPSTGTYAGTWVWGYLQPGQVARASYLGPVIVARRGVPTEIEWLNELGDTSETHLAAFTSATDQTLHWADPLNGGASACAEHVEPAAPPTGLCAENYAGPIPGVTHLHGGEVPSKIDGGPDAWYTSDGAHRGHAYYSRPGNASNGAIYRYPNMQEAAPIWFHDHVLADAHPIHLHLVQFQILDRRSFDQEAYEEVYEGAFPGGTDPMGGHTYPPGVFVPGFGPPLDYRAERNPLSGGKDGGNPDVTPYLRGRPRPPRPNEAGWKDTVRVPPGSVTRILVRWAPAHLRRRTPRQDAWYPFDPDGGHGYVWHCHILDHEDNEMMRPTSVQANPNAARTYVEGSDF